MDKTSCEHELNKIGLSSDSNQIGSKIRIKNMNYFGKKVHSDEQTSEHPLLDIVCQHSKEVERNSSFQMMQYTPISCPFPLSSRSVLTVRCMLNEVFN